MARSPGFDKLESLCGEAVAQGVLPGLVVVGFSEGEPRVRAAWGARQIDPEALPATPDTLYDVASLTKALVTSVLAMKHVARGALDLEARVADWLPAFAGAGKGAVTVRHLLAHASGLPAHRPLSEWVTGAASERFVIELLAAKEELEYQPGTRSLYSDLGFIVLGWLLERIGGLRLDVQAERDIFVPLGLTSAAFVNLADTSARAHLLARHEVAPTRRLAPGRLLHGEVDDDNARAMRGIAGHAGLFAAVDDVARIALALVAAWSGAPGALVPRAVIREFWEPAGVAGSTWRLGWDGPAPRDSLAGDLIARSAVGHLGFTGCSVWIDPGSATFVVVLANRVHPRGDDNPRFRALRPALHDAVLHGMGYPPPPRSRS